ncbi:MAG: aspartate kinase [Bacteroidetes bacterium SW_11_45_7]|nr:MAG: aspartate kinase [Bacteroidetes bacterium SW_11_45_7]
MNIFKFGGMSVKDADAIRNAAQVIQDYGQEPLVVVVSAMGKTTNALEELTNAFIEQREGYYKQFEEIRDGHFQVIRELFGDDQNEVSDEVNDLFVEIEWIIEERPFESYGYLYDQIVSIGEFASTRILSGYLEACSISNTWFDVRDLIKTDNAYQQANVLWDETAEVFREAEATFRNGITVTQGFLGCTSENFTTTLGREGSDFSAAILAHLLDADQVTVWKDVPGIFNADPDQFGETFKIDAVSYLEAVEMTYYGAKVIHPKTIKPLENKGIPLYIKSFLHPDQPGTVISSEPVSRETFPPVIVFKRDQLLLNLRTKDFSFIEEDNMSLIYQIFARHRTGINMMQKADLDLLTIRHYDENSLARYTKNRASFITQKDQVTVQCLMEGERE